MPKSAKFLTQPMDNNSSSQYDNQNYNNGSIHDKQISFDHLTLMEKSSDNNTSPSICMDHVFHQICINGENYEQVKVNGEGQNKSKGKVWGIQQKSKSKQVCKSKQSRKQTHKSKQNDKIVQQRQQFNRKLQASLSKSKQKYKKGIDQIQRKQKQANIQNIITRFKIQNQKLVNQINQLNKQVQKMQRQKIKNLNKFQQQRCEYNTKEKQLVNQLKQIKSEIQKKQHQKDKFSKNYKNMQQKFNEKSIIIQQLQKKLRIKQKQAKKYQQFQKQRSTYYQTTFLQKQTQIQTLQSQLNKKSQQNQQICQSYALVQQQLKQREKQLEKYVNQNCVLYKKIVGLQATVKNYQGKIQRDCKQISIEIQQKIEVINRLGGVIAQAIKIMQNYLKQSTNYSKNTTSQFSTKSTYQNHHSQTFFSSLQQKPLNFKSTIRTDQSQLKNFLTLLLQTINKNSDTIIRKQNQVKQFKDRYYRELEHLDQKMEYLAEENKYLKVKVNNQTVFNLQKERQLYFLKENQELRKLSRSRSLQKFMHTQKIYNQPNIKQQILSNHRANTLQHISTQPQLQSRPRPKIRHQLYPNSHQKQSDPVIQQVQKARKIYKEVTLRSRSQSVGSLRNSRYNINTNNYGSNCCQSNVLMKRSRNSLSWKKPPEILKEYV